MENGCRGSYLVKIPVGQNSFVIFTNFYLCNVTNIFWIQRKLVSTENKKKINE